MNDKKDKPNIYGLLPCVCGNRGVLVLTDSHPAFASAPSWVWCPLCSRNGPRMSAPGEAVRAWNDEMKEHDEDRLADI